VTTTLVWASTVPTIPTRPSGLSAAASGFTPSLAPAEVTMASGLVGSDWGSTSAAT